MAILLLSFVGLEVKREVLDTANYPHKISGLTNFLRLSRIFAVPAHGLSRPSTIRDPVNPKVWAISAGD